MHSNRKREIFVKMLRYQKKCRIIARLCVTAAAVSLFIIMNWGRDGFSTKLSDSIATVFEGEDGNVTTVSRASLEKVFEISELSTADYTYNAVARAYAEDGTTIKYYVAYEGRVKAGIDFQNINIDIDEESKRITITIPDIEFQEKTVNPGTMEFIFQDKKSETENVHQEAFELCRRDFEQRIGKEKALLKSAEENTTAVIEALVIPWVTQLDREYLVDIR